MKKIVLIGLLSLSLGCASLSGARHGVAVVGITSGAALDLVKDTAKRVRCGNPGAPAAPVCLPDADYKAIRSKLEVAYDLHGKLMTLTLSIPEGAPTTAQTLQLGTDLAELVNGIIALFPAPQQATLNKQIK
jgi:hypothetical protein